MCVRRVVRDVALQRVHGLARQQLGQRCAVAFGVVPLLRLLLLLLEERPVVLLRRMLQELAVHGRVGRQRKLLQACNFFLRVQQLQRLPFDEAERLHVALAELVGRVAELLLRRRRGLAVVALEALVDLVESVHVELPDERRYVDVLEVLRKHVGELPAGIDAKRVAGRRPSDQVRETDVLEHVVEFVDEHGLRLAAAAGGGAVQRRTRAAGRLCRRSAFSGRLRRAVAVGGGRLVRVCGR